MIDNFEKLLGRIVEGWSDQSSSESAKIQVVRTNHNLNDGVSIYSTLGLSSFPLKRNDKNSYFIEFSICLLSDSESQWAPGALLELGNKISQSGVVPLRGDVIQVSPFDVKGMTVAGFYVTTPLFLDDGARSIYADGKDIAIVWLVPLTEDELIFSAKVDWRRFEDCLETVLETVVELPRPSFIGV